MRNPSFYRSTIFKNFFVIDSESCSCTNILSVLPIAQLGERQTVVLKVVGSNPTLWILKPR